MQRLVTLMTSSDLTLRQKVETELCTNILPFWIKRVVDRTNGGFYGAVTNDLRVLYDVPRSAVLCARILWTYSAAYRRFGDGQYLQMARHACDYLTHPFWDDDHGGIYWTLDARGRSVDSRKHVYAQAFAIYGLSEYYRAVQDTRGLSLAQTLFSLVEAHTHDPIYGGNLEGCSREWATLEDMRLSERDLNSRKSMNTLLHLMEAYANLLCIWDAAELRAKLRELLELFIYRIVDPQTDHLRLFFDDAWHSLSPVVSYGHDIEASWLMVEAAQVLGDPGLLARVSELAVLIAEAMCAEGLDADGGVVYESGPGVHAESADKQWWAQAEAVVGFYNAYQLTARRSFAEAANRCWDYAERKFVDRLYGDWFKRLAPDGNPYADHYKAGPWECPYHHARACLELLARLKET